MTETAEQGECLKAFGCRDRATTPTKRNEEEVVREGEILTRDRATKMTASQNRARDASPPFGALVLGMK